jgi:Flp pilus assembly protein TadG
VAKRTFHRSVGKPRLKAALKTGHVMRKFLNRTALQASAAAKRFASDTRGVAAVEFVFIAPLIIALWLGTTEISLLIEVNKKVGRSASVIGDLVAQMDFIPVSDLDDAIKIGASILQPYNRDKPTITVSSVYVDAGLKAKVKWSRRGRDTTFAPGLAVNSEVTEFPVNLKVADTYIIMVKADLNYYPITNTAYVHGTRPKAGVAAAWPMTETYYLRPRLTEYVTCTGC